VGIKMKLFATINNNIVENIIHADSGFIKHIANDYQFIVDVTNIECNIGYTYDGTVFVSNQPIIPMPTVLASALTEIDLAAASARARHVTDGFLQQHIYDMKSTEAQAYISAGYPKISTNYPLLTHEAKLRKITLKVLADSIISTKSNWLVLAGTIEGLRIKGKSDVSSAIDIPSIIKVKDAAIASLTVL